MKRTKLLSIILLFLSGIIVSSEIAKAQTFSAQIAFQENFRLEEGTVRYYVASLNESSIWTMNCTAIYDGIFNIFIFQTRPRQSYIDEATKNLTQEIYTAAVAYNNTPSFINSTVQPELLVSYIELSFTVPTTGLYYMCVVIVENAPDSFILNSNYELQPYFIPYIPGYPIEWVGMCSVFMIFAIIKYKKKKTTSIYNRD